MAAQVCATSPRGSAFAVRTVTTGSVWATNSSSLSIRNRVRRWMTNQIPRRATSSTKLELCKPVKSSQLDLREAIKHSRAKTYSLRMTKDRMLKMRIWITRTSPWQVTRIPKEETARRTHQKRVEKA